MSTQMDVKELAGHLNEALRRVRGGEEILVSDSGKPVARLIPADKRVFGEYKGKVRIAEDFAAPLGDDEQAEWER